jgi:uncharacterized protein YlxP (DUF503 family)
MIVGVAALEIQIHGSNSLKEKRGVVQSICRRLRNRFPVSVAEVGGQDLWQRALLGVTAIGSDAGRSQGPRAGDRLGGEMHLAELIRSRSRSCAFPYQEMEPEADEPGAAWTTLR